MWITPYHQDTDFPRPLKIDDKITIFYEQIDGWLLDIADQCINGRNESNYKIRAINHSGFAVLQIVFCYFEAIGKYETGYTDKFESRKHFKKGLKSVFPELKIMESLSDTLYEGARCGLYHSAMPDSRIIITGAINEVIIEDLENNKIIINPHKLVLKLRAHLINYIDEIKDANNSILKQNFESRFDYLMAQF